MATREEQLGALEHGAAERERRLVERERAVAERERALATKDRTPIDARNGVELTLLRADAARPWVIDGVAPNGSARGDDAGPAPALTVDVLVPGAHRVLDSELERRTQVTAALANVAIPGRRLVVANLLGASSAILGEVESAGAAGALVIGYAADRERSRILGAIRCFDAPPSATDAAAAVETPGRVPRRIITLSDDVDAFIGAKTGLTKAGHSVAMACDAKQAIDLLAMLTPDAVLVDARTAPEAAAQFLAALAPESGRVLFLLVYGPMTGDALSRVLERLVRPGALATEDLVRVCDAVISGPATGAKTAAAKAVRALERPKSLPRKTVARRVIRR